MRLSSIQVENYRSIIRTQTLEFNRGLTVILGPNNEGKSNILRATVLAMRLLNAIQMRAGMLLVRSKDGAFRMPGRHYSWENDFPKSLQKKFPDGKTVLTLCFDLSAQEREKFGKMCGSANNGSLLLEIRIENEVFFVKAKKPGRAAKAYAKKNREIAEFISHHFTFQYIPAIRTEEQSLEVISDLIERRLSSIENDEKYKEAIKTIEDLQEPLIQDLEQDVLAQMKKLLPSIKKVELTSVSSAHRRGPIIGHRGRLRSAQLVIDDGTATDLESKGDGIKSLAAISLMGPSKSSSEKPSLVVAIEEPESHLHPGATRQLSGVLEEMSKEHQVIITTHSPLLVSKASVSANIIVSKSKATPAKSMKDIRKSLGVHVSDNLEYAEHVMLVEGINDIRLLTALFSQLSPDFTDLLNQGKIAFDDMGGAGNVPYKLSTLRMAVTSPILITDDDRAGRKAVKDAKDAGNLDEKYIFSWKRQNKSATEIEDLILSDLYWAEAETVFGVTLDKASFVSANDGWSERMKHVYQSGGKSWSASIENNFKSLIASAVEKSPASAIDPSHSDLVNNVIKAVVKIVKNDAA